MGTATITEWDLQSRQPVSDSQAVSMLVDFDPQSLELSYQVTGPAAAQEATPATPKNKTPAQNTGQSATLTMTLLFDTTTSANVSVQSRTDPLVQLTVPRGAGPQSPGEPRVIRFQWGSFLYYGTVASLSQTIDFFSDTGVPLRSTVRLTIKQVSPPEQGGSGSSPAGAGAGGGLGLGFGASVGLGASASFGASASLGASASFGASASLGAGASIGASASFGASASAGIGTTPLTLTQSGDTVQAIAARAGGSVSWKAVAAANNIDNPRMLPPGTVLSASAGAQLRASAG